MTDVSMAVKTADYWAGETVADLAETMDALSVVSMVDDWVAGKAALKEESWAVVMVDEMGATLAGHLADCSVVSMALLWVVSKDAMKVVQTGCSTAVSLVDETACAMVAW